MEKEQQSEAQSAGLIYGLNDRPPVKDAVFAALQHLLAIFVAIITPPLIIAGALKLDLETTSFLVSMSLFVSGLSTLFSAVVSVLLAVACCAFREPVFHLSVRLSRRV